MEKLWYGLPWFYYGIPFVCPQKPWVAMDWTMAYHGILWIHLKHHAAVINTNQVALIAYRPKYGLVLQL